MQKLLVLVVCLTPRSGSAERELSLAIKGGPNAATLAEEDRSNRSGFTGGLAGHLSWPLANRLSLGPQLELLYTPRGAEATFEGEFVGQTRSNYLDLAAVARPEARLGPVSFYLLLGGSLSFLVNGEKEFASGAKEDITEGLHRLDVSLLAGAGVAFHLPRSTLGPLRLGAIFVEGRLDHGLRDTDAVNGGYQNRTTALMFGFSLVLQSREKPGVAKLADPQPAAVPVAE